LLRRTQTIAAKVETEAPAPSAPQSVAMMRANLEGAFGASGETLRKPMQPQQRMIGNTVIEELPPPPTSALPASAVQAVERRQADRRQTDRRSMDQLREDTKRNATTRPEDKGAWRQKNQWRSGIRPSRIALVAVALTAGGVAAFLAMQGGSEQPIAQPATELITEVVQEARTQILVAKGVIGVGDRLSPATVEWVDWPEGAVRPEYISIASSPNAVMEMIGSMARFEFFPGEPIRPQKLALPGEGYLSAVLDSGMRGVSVAVAPESASGGFIVPNDHVDVVLTFEADGAQVSETILHNVRVLAINARLGEKGENGEEGDSENPEEDPNAWKVGEKAIATLALDPNQAEVIISATKRGEFALVLRSMTDFADANTSGEGAANTAIRMTSPFWTNTMSTGSSELQ
jgi:pilus assembly protein CpaB